MEITLEGIRQSVIDAFKTAHEITHAGVLVNYPNYVVVDLEHQRAPFVSVDFEITDSSRAALGEREIQGMGVLRVYYYYRNGTGTSGAYTYADSLNDNLGMMFLGGIYYTAAKVTDIVSFPGWTGKMLEFNFSAVDGPDC